jgi:hypothetical protein
VNGSEDEEVLTRMQPVQADSYYHIQARQLEALRQEIDRLESAAGNLVDYIDRGHPTPAEERAAVNEMEIHQQSARQLCQQLQTQVETLRRDCPKILTTWAEAHLRVCRCFLSSLPKTGTDADTARYVAQSTLADWEQLPLGGAIFISINTYWLEGYLECLEKEI